jgi:hypothetical protein
MKALVLAASMLVACLCAPISAKAQEERSWRSEDGVFGLTIPEMWNAVEPPSPAPAVLLFLRSLQLGPAGPAQIVCSVEANDVESDLVFDRPQLNAMTEMAFEDFYEHETNPEIANTTINGVWVGGYEVAGMDDQLFERRFARMFVTQRSTTLRRHIIVCAVRTVRPASAIDYAAMRTFLASLQINSDTP